MARLPFTTQAVPLSDLETRLIKIEKEIAALTAKRELLNELLKGSSEVHATKTPVAALQASGPGVRDGILDLLEVRPGLSATEVAEDLESKIASRAKDKKNVIRTTLAKMVTDGLVARSETGKHSVVAESGEQT
jgi:hypothetical protein